MISFTGIRTLRLKITRGYGDPSPLTKIEERSDPGSGGAALEGEVGKRGGRGCQLGP